MRDQNKGGNLYYVELFVVDKIDYEYVCSVGIDLITNQYIFVAYNENTYRLINPMKFKELLK